MLRRLVLAGLAALLMAACTSGDDPSSSPTTFQGFDTTTTALPTTPVIGRALSPERGSVQGNGGRGMVVVLTFTARDPTVLPAELRTALATPAGAAAVARPGRNPAFPGLVVGLTTTSAALGGPSANLANLFQVVSPAIQLDGSIQVSAVWTNAQPEFGSDADATLGAYVVSGGAAPDVIPETQANIDVISNPVEVTFRVSGNAASPAVGAAGGATTTTPTTIRGATTTTGRATTTTARVATTTVGPVATTVAPVTTARPVTTTRPATTTTPTTALCIPLVTCPP